MIRALYQPSVARFLKDAYPGSFCIEPRQNADEFEFRYFCPCGCGHEGRLLVGKQHKPISQRASWFWNGSLTEPRLEPSVDHRQHWHGWLRNGYWEKC